MSVAHVNGVDIYYELHGTGAPLALVHGSWTDATRWDLVLPGLTGSFQVLVYDRRGHSRSRRVEGQGSVDEDGDDLAALLETLALAPAHVVANSWGGNVALRLACRRPELFRSLTCHEPPLWGLLEGDPDSRPMLARSGAALEAVGARIAAGDHEGGARLFVDEVVFGPGTWDGRLPPDVREMFVRNAPTFLDELRDPDQLSIDEHALASLGVPVRLTAGSASPPVFARVIDRLADLIPVAGREAFEGAGHAIQSTMPDVWVAATRRAVGWATDHSATGGPA